MVISEKILSKHNIKPSSPTPNRFRNHKLSFLDQIQPLFHVPCLFLYQNDDETKPKQQQAVISQLVRQSLSEILSVFYPLAGTLKENSMVYCDDSGVELVEAQVHARLAEFMVDAEMEDLTQLVPVDGSDNKHALMLVKLSFFDCGGIALGVGFSHKIADFASFAMFMNAWAATCRGELANVTQPTFDLEPYFPQKDSTPIYTPQDTEKIATKRLVFDKEKLERLKNEVELKNPTSVEAVTGFLWKQFIEATKVKVADTEKMSFLVSQSMNLRPRVVPPMPEHSFGNCSNPALVIVPATTSSSDLISKLRVAIKAVDINEMIINIDEVKDENGKVGGIIGFSSLRRFPVYDVDFGWGKPVRVCVTTMPYLNSVILMSTPSGDGIEALLNMTQDVLQILQTNYNRIFNYE